MGGVEVAMRDRTEAIEQRPLNKYRKTNCDAVIDQHHQQCCRLKSSEQLYITVNCTSQFLKSVNTFFLKRLQILNVKFAPNIVKSIRYKQIV